VALAGARRIGVLYRTLGGRRPGLFGSVRLGLLGVDGDSAAEAKDRGRHGFKETPDKRRSDPIFSMEGCHVAAPFLAPTVAQRSA